MFIMINMCVFVYVHMCIEIIQFSLKIFDLWRHSHPWVGVWVVG